MNKFRHSYCITAPLHRRQRDLFSSKFFRFGFYGHSAQYSGGIRLSRLYSTATQQPPIEIKCTVIPENPFARCLLTAAVKESYSLVVVGRPVSRSFRSNRHTSGFQAVSFVGSNHIGNTERESCTAMIKMRRTLENCPHW